MPQFFSPWTPPADLFHSGNRWLIKIELAGISPDEVEIVPRGATLQVRGSRRDMTLRQGFACHSMEITYSKFARSFSFPGPIDPASVQWDYQQGILLISVSLDERGGRP